MPAQMGNKKSKLPSKLAKAKARKPLRRASLLKSRARSRRAAQVKTTMATVTQAQLHQSKRTTTNPEMNMVNVASADHRYLRLSL